jgi:RHS repeat-associated protein
MTLVELPNGVETSYTYDDGDRLTDIEHMLGLSTLAFVNYTLDNVGNRTQRIDGQGTHVYAYDDVYRLTSVTYPGPSTTSYVYDAFGNRTSMTVGANTTTYAYDDNDGITSVTPPSASPIAYTWDDNGNLEDRGSDEFIWDYEDRLVETTVNSVTTEFAYRGDGLRDSRTVGISTTTFTWDIAAGIPVVLDDGSRYIYGAHGLIAQVEGSDWYYFLSDGLGSTMAITDDVGTVVRDYTYDVYGEVTGGSGTVDSEFQFAGEQVDGSTGLQYLRNRYYDMESGTFISRDPMAAGPGWLEHSFSYATSNPTNLVDPLGLFGGPPGCDQFPLIRHLCKAPEVVGSGVETVLNLGSDGLESILNLIASLPVGAASDYLLDSLAFQIISGVFLVHRWAHTSLKSCVLAEYCRKAGDSLFDLNTILAADLGIYLRGLGHGLHGAVKAIGAFGTVGGFVWWAYARWADASESGRLRRAVGKLERLGTP